MLRCKSLLIFFLLLICPLFAPSGNELVPEDLVAKIIDKISCTSIWIMGRSHEVFTEELPSYKPCIEHKKKLCLECYDKVICPKRKDEFVLGYNILNEWWGELIDKKAKTTYSRLKIISKGYEELMEKAQLSEIRAATLSEPIDSLEIAEIGVCFFCKEHKCIKTYRQVVGRMYADLKRKIAEREAS